MNADSKHSSSFISVQTKQAAVSKLCYSFIPCTQQSMLLLTKQATVFQLCHTLVLWCPQGLDVTTQQQDGLRTRRLVIAIGASPWVEHGDGLLSLPCCRPKSGHGLDQSCMHEQRTSEFRNAHSPPSSLKEPDFHRVEQPLPLLSKLHEPVWKMINVPILRCCTDIPFMSVHLNFES